MVMASLRCLFLCARTIKPSHDQIDRDHVCFFMQSSAVLISHSRNKFFNRSGKAPTIKNYATVLLDKGCQASAF